MSVVCASRFSSVVASACAVALAACTVAPAPRPPASAAPATAAVAPAPPRPVPERRFSYETEAQWRQAVAAHILDMNRQRVFEGRPPHPLKAVVVLELTVGADGQIERVAVLRAPSHARELGDAAVQSARAASPGPPPPTALVRRGAVRFTETWLFRQDNRFQLRSLAQEQVIE